MEESKGIVMEGNTDGEGKPIRDQTIREREDGAKIHMMSRADDFKMKNIRGCYKAYRKLKPKDHVHDKLFKHYHYTTKEIDIMQAEVARLKDALTTQPHDEDTSVFLDVKQIIEDYEIPPVEEKIENSED